ncbi:unnamed protein product [Darwinula stevensoni]|uniref:Uncharacterized protein n=1 Tax=Darwinula stevensoni TaxID=69355 RepID=A0A7R8XDR8_9CRUS|nr:unnamed protein product [Darwinula stevensoni]CAG0893779.1 unnamed protein product [Darwinula stevensoni]
MAFRYLVVAALLALGATVQQPSRYSPARPSYKRPAPAYPAKQPAYQPAYQQPAYEPAKQPAYQPAYKPAKQPAYEPAYQPAYSHKRPTYEAYDDPPYYSFSYDVKDDYSYNDFGHSETRNLRARL